MRITLDCVPKIGLSVAVTSSSASTSNAKPPPSDFQGP
ncbi:hypothetical protein ABIC63_001701 [Pseudacidovorax sp. 1753]